MRSLRFTQSLALLVLLALLAGSSLSTTPASAHLGPAMLALASPYGWVSITRDAVGVPFIRAHDEDGAQFGLGYAHAQDRLWQMEWQRRLGAGRTAELRGPDGLAAGINALLADGQALPPEFAIFGFEPEPWTGVDVLAFNKLFLWGNGSTWDKELLRARLAALLGPERAAQLAPAYTADGPTIIPSAEHGPRFNRSIPNGGDRFTVNVASSFRRWEDYDQFHAAQYRQIIDLRHLRASRWIVAPGQSGDPDGAHYDDLLTRWRQMKYLPMRFTRAGQPK